MKYRSEIDGLRALAVIPVILCHAGFELFRGGFIGVDVFFVISGYLITTIILNEMELNSFSLLSFYERRARRILPALFFMITCCIPVAWILLMPGDMQDFSASVGTTAIFLSNFFFLSQTGYFGSDAHFQPLMHLWSLSVEEQFYLLFPALMIATYRKTYCRMIFYIGLVFLLSIVAAEWGSRFDAERNYFHSFTRFWELLIGAFLALYLRNHSVSTPTWLNNLLSIIGLSALIFSVFEFSESTVFPSIYTLVPTVGTALIILFATRGTLVNSLLSLPIFVGIGLISYSLYLWHQPVFAFWRHYNLVELTQTQIIMAIVVAITLAISTYFIVERPFRGTDAVLNRHQVFSISGIMILILFIFGLFGYLSNGQFYVNDERTKNSNISDRISINHGLHRDCDDHFNLSSNCYSDNEPEVLLWGDSFAMHLVQGIEASNKNIRLQQHTKSACSPILDAAIVSHKFSQKWAEDCIKFNNNVFSWLKENKTVKLVVLSSTFNIVQSDYLSSGELYSPPASEEHIFAQVKNTISQIYELGIDVLIVSPTPYSGRDNGRCVAQAMFMNSDKEICDFYDKERASYGFLRRIAGYVPIYWLSNNICEDNLCKANIGNILLYRDDGHLSKEGSKYLGAENNWYTNWLQISKTFSRSRK